MHLKNVPQNVFIRFRAPKNTMFVYQVVGSAIVAIMGAVDDPTNPKYDRAPFAYWQVDIVEKPEDITC